jgi:hypothetical protein
MSNGMHETRYLSSVQSRLATPLAYAAVIDALERTPSLVGIDAVERYFICKLSLSDAERRELSDALELARRLVERAGNRGA